MTPEADLHDVGVQGPQRLAPGPHHDPVQGISQRCKARGFTSRNHDLRRQLEQTLSPKHSMAEDALGNCCDLQFQMISRTPGIGIKDVSPGSCKVERLCGQALCPLLW